MVKVLLASVCIPFHTVLQCYCDEDVHCGQGHECVPGGTFPEYKVMAQISLVIIKDCYCCYALLQLSKMLAAPPLVDHFLIHTQIHATQHKTHSNVIP